LHPVAALVQSFTGRRDVAEEITQDAFVIAHARWRRISGYDNPRRLRPPRRPHPGRLRRPPHPGRTAGRRPARPAAVRGATAWAGWGPDDEGAVPKVARIELTQRLVGDRLTGTIGPITR
jgi:hypothetical protein